MGRLPGKFRCPEASIRLPGTRFGRPTLVLSGQLGNLVIVVGCPGKSPNTSTTPPFRIHVQASRWQSPRS